jgi:tetratricopeptide (TPR) repeat protein
LNDVPTIPAPLHRLDPGLRLGLGVTLALLGLLVYLPALSAGFVYDDHSLIEGNRTVASLGAAFGAFFEPLWAFDPEGEIPNAFWRPLTVLLLAGTREVVGLTPSGFHTVSLVLHIAATWAAWRLATRLMRCGTLGWLAAALFAVHPVHVESVAWASAVNDPLFALFALLSLERYFAWRERGLRGVPWAAGLWLLPALLAKEQAVIVPLVALVIDLAFRHLRLRGEGAGNEVVRAYAPWAIVGAVYFVGRMVAYGSVMAGLDQVSADFGLSFAREALLRVEVFGAFLESLLAPSEYRFFRQVRPELPEGHAPMLRAWAAVLVWAAATGVAAWQSRRLALAMLLAIPACFLLLLVDVEAAGAFPISDRYLYLPVIFAAVLVVGLLAKFLPRPAVFGVGLALCGAGAWSASARVAIFEDDLTLYRAAMEAEPDNLRGRVFLGDELLEVYRQTLDKEYLDEALFHFLTGLMLGFDYGKYTPKLGADEPWIKRAKELDILVNGVSVTELRKDETVFISGFDRITANLGLGECTLALGNLPPEYDLEWPQQVFEHILKRFPKMPKALDGLGRTQFRQRDYEGAEATFREVLEQDRSYVNTWHNLGVLLASLGRFDEARSCFDEALRLRPGYRDTLVKAAACAIDGARFPQVEDYIQRLERAHPEDPEAQFLRGMLCAVRGDLNGAIERFDLLLAREARHVRGHLQRAKALAALGDRSEAIRAFRRAAELQPDSFEAHYHLTTLLLQNPEAQEEAIPYLERAYQLSPPNELRSQLHGLLHGLLLRASMSDLQAMDAVMGYARLDQQRRDFVHALSWVDSARLQLQGRLAKLQSGEDDPKLRNNLVFLLNMRGELLEGLANSSEEQRESYLAGAHDSYVEGLRLEPEHFFLNYNLAILLATKLQRLDRAAAYARVALDGIDSLGQPAARAAVERTLRSILEHPPETGPFLEPTDDGDAGDDG